MTDVTTHDQPAEEPVTVPLNTELAGWLAAYRRAKQKARQWGDTADQAQKHITDALDAAGAEVGTVDGTPAVRWVTVKYPRVDAARLRSEHPELAAQYQHTVVSHRFTMPNPRNNGDHTGDQDGAS